MAMLIRGKRVVCEEIEHGVRFTDGFELICGNEEDARTTRAITGGDLIARDVYTTGWSVVDN